MMMTMMIDDDDGLFQRKNVSKS